MVKWLLVMFVGVMVVTSPYLTFAQEEEAEEGVEYGYGTVIKVDESKKEIVVSEYDWESDSEVTITYSLAPDLELENVNSLAEITPDTYVDIEYIVGEGNKRIAKFISIYEPESLTE